MADQRGGWADLQTAARVRDIIRNGIGREVSEVNKKLIGRCINVDLASLNAQVWFPGDEAPTNVKMFSSVIPASWEQKGFPTISSTSTNGYGGMVLCEDYSGTLYITDVLTGGTIQQQPSGGTVSPIGSDSAPGNPHYAAIAVNIKQPVDIPVGGSVTFGPFRRQKPNATSPAGGAITVIVEDTESDYLNDDADSNVGTSRTFEFNLAAFGQYHIGTELGTTSSDLATFSSDPMEALPRYYRVLPSQYNQMFGNSASYDDLDLEVGLRRSVQGGATTQAPTWEIWFRVINRRFAAHDMDYTITIVGSVIQTAIGADNKFTTTVQTVADPNGGYIGFHEAANGMFESEDFAWSFPFKVIDTFGRSVEDGLGSNYLKYVWEFNAFNVMSVSNRAIFKIASANVEVKADLRRTFFCKDYIGEFGTSAIALGQAIKVGFKYNRSSSTSFFWAAIHFNTGGTVSYSINKRVSGTDTVLQTGTVSYLGVGMTYNTSTRLMLRVKYLPGGTHTVSIWNKAGGFEALADKYTYATDATYPGGNSTTPVGFGTTGGIIVSQATGGSNTYPVNVSCYYFEGSVNPGSEDTADQSFWGNRFAGWNTGPWRSSLLRSAELLQRTMTFSDSIVWNGSKLKWIGTVLLGGIGPNRNALLGGSAYVSMPKSITGFNWTIPTFSSNDGTPIEVDNTDGIPIAAGTGLWVAIKPGARYQDLKPYLFLVNDYSDDRDANFDLPEWAVLIAYRPLGCNFLVLGNGEEAYVTPGGEQGSSGAFAGTTTENAGSYTDMGSPASLTFTRARTNSRLEVTMSGTFQTSSTATGAEFALRIGGTDYDIVSLKPPVSAANVHLPFSSKRILAAGVGGALSAATLQGRMKRSGGAGTITTDTSDSISITVREIP